jgi:hypothetical protein
LVTNVPPAQLTLREALSLARVRWQVERLFKLWQGHGHIDESRSTKPWRLLCEAYAKLVALLVPHWVFLVRGWTAPERSLMKAAQTVQQHALHMASALPRWPRRLIALTPVAPCIAAGCRMHRRRQQPNTSQLLLDETSLTITFT